MLFLSITLAYASSEYKDVKHHLSWLVDPTRLYPPYAAATLCDATGPHQGNATS
jgi:hypothetical protein